MKDRGEWLEARRKGIGGSDAAAILGLSKYRSAIDVWEDKLGLAEERPQTTVMRWGLALEETIAAAYTEETGRAVRRPGGIRRAHHVEGFPMIGSLDRIVYSIPTMPYDGLPRIVELKTKRSDADLEPDHPVPEKRVPPDWYVQGQHYLAVARAEYVDFAVLVAGSQFMTIEVPIDDDFVSDLIVEERRFWRDYVVAEQQPPVSADDLAFLSRKYPTSELEEMVASPELAELVDAYLEAVTVVTVKELHRDELRAKIEDQMGTAAKLLTPSATVSWKSHERTTTAWKEVASAYRNALEKAHDRLGHVVNVGNGVTGREVLEHLLEDGFGTRSLDDVESLYRSTSTVRPFRVDRKKEA